MKHLLFALFYLYFTQVAVAGSLIKCQGADGKISFSDTPCPERPGMKTLSASAGATAPAGSPSKRLIGPYVRGKSPFTDQMLQAFVLKCNQGVREACTYAEKVRGGNYDFGNFLLDTAEEGCNKGDMSECDRLCRIDEARAWCKKRQAMAPKGTPRRSP